MYRNRLDKDIKKARQEYFANFFATAAGCSEIMWKRLNSVLRHHPPISKVLKLDINGIELSGKRLADTFNTYFASARNTPMLPNDLSNIPVNSNTIFLKPVDENEISHIIQNLNNSSAKDIDGLQIKPLKYVVDILAPCIAYIFNLCLNQAIFPSKMKEARISVLYKKGDKNDMSNYRPISILPMFSKVLEKVILNRFMNFEQKHNLLNECQFGFLRKS